MGTQTRADSVNISMVTSLKTETYFSLAKRPIATSLVVMVSTTLLYLSFFGWTDHVMLKCLGYWLISAFSTPVWWFLIRHSIKKDIENANVVPDSNLIDAAKRQHSRRTAKLVTFFFVFPIGTEFHDWLMDESGLSGTAYLLVSVLAIVVAITAWSIYLKILGPVSTPFIDQKVADN